MSRPSQRLRCGQLTVLCFWTFSFLAFSCRNEWSSGGRGREEDRLEDDRGRVPDNLAKKLIVPAWEVVAAAGASLEAASVALEERPNAERLESAREAWREARSAWNRAEAVLFGPAADRFLDVKIDTWPIDAARIQALVDGAMDPRTLDVEALGATQKGFAAIEMLLFEEDADGARILVGNHADRRRGFARAFSTDLARVTEEIRDTWLPTGGNYLQAFLSSASGQPGRSIDLLVNRMLLLAETTADIRLDRPLGRGPGGRPQPPTAESELSGNSLRDVLDDIAGLTAVYTGKRSGGTVPGLSRLVRSSRPEADALALDALAEATASLAAIPETLLDAARNSPAVVESARARVKELVHVLGVDVTAALDTTLTFSPFDGD